mmetsp:Transcript_37992/g.61736  ORF Transcript_37992/g.61736 Transcript_37992/m.61736 type:complete len:423 (-) Transcript_37992:184-1452(-)
MLGSAAQVHPDAKDEDSKILTKKRGEATVPGPAHKPAMGATVLVLFFTLLSGIIIGLCAGWIFNPYDSDDSNDTNTVTVTTTTGNNGTLIPKFGVYPIRSEAFEPCNTACAANFSAPTCNISHVRRCYRISTDVGYSYAYDSTSQYPSLYFANASAYSQKLGEWRHRLHDFLPNRDTAERLALDKSELATLNEMMERRFDYVDLRYGSGFRDNDIASHCHPGAFCHALSVGQKNFQLDLYFWEDCSLFCAINVWVAANGLSYSTQVNTQITQAGIIVGHLKTYFNRARPQQSAGNLNVTFKYVPAFSGNTPAFPSGHCIQGKMAIAQIYHENFALFQSNATLTKELLKWAYDIGDRRMVGGVHWPTDNYASNTLANDLMAISFPNTSAAHIHWPVNATEMTHLCGASYPSMCNSPRVPHKMA